MKSSPVRRSWRNHDTMYVIGCIDAAGAITANPSKVKYGYTDNRSMPNIDTI